MTHPVIKRVQRIVDDSKQPAGMHVGLPQVTLDRADVEWLLKAAAQYIDSDGEHEQLREGVRALASEIEAIPSNASPSCIAEQLSDLLGED